MFACSLVQAERFRRPIGNRSIDFICLKTKSRIRKRTAAELITKITHSNKINFVLNHETLFFKHF